MSELAERLATWLEELGLAEHLADAGLPSLTRDVEGRALWTDPATGEPLSVEQLEALDGLLHAEGDDPTYAVPVSLVQLRRWARLRTELRASPWFTYQTLAELRGESVNATRFSVHKANEQHAVLVVADDKTIVIPGFQFTETGDPRPELAPVLQPLLAAGMDDWSAWTWLTQPAALLGGLVPHEAAVDPEMADLAQHAAVRLAARVAAGR